jgi:hypothetical protein
MSGNKDPRRNSGGSKPSPIVRARNGNSTRLLNNVRRLAKQQQRDTPCAFLSLRNAAERFGVSVSEMATVYRLLAEEGMLTAIRGSRTMLRPEGAGRSLRVAGFIGIPVSTFRFLTLREYREAFLNIRHELFARGFASRCIFFEGLEIDADALIEAFSKAGVDSLLWLLPQFGRDTALKLRDRGIHFIGVSFASAPPVFCRYEVQRRRAISTIFDKWRSEAPIRTATIFRVRGETKEDSQRIRRVQALAESQGIECKLEVLPDRHLPAFVKARCGEDGSGVVLPAPAASTLAWREPETVVQMLSACRVALIDGPVDLAVPQSVPESAAADVVTVDWRPIAGRIALDAATGKALLESDPIVFQARPQIRVPLEQIGLDQLSRRSNSRTTKAG